MAAEIKGKKVFKQLNYLKKLWKVIQRTPKQTVVFRNSMETKYLGYNSNLLKLLLFVFGFGSQAFICKFSRQNICSVTKVQAKGKAPIAPPVPPVLCMYYTMYKSVDWASKGRIISPFYWLFLFWTHGFLFFLQHTTSAFNFRDLLQR